MKADLERSKERLSHVFETLDLALIYTKSPGVYNHDPRPRDLFRASVSETVLPFWRKGLTKESSIMMVGFNERSEIPSQLSMWANLMSKI